MENRTWKKYSMLTWIFMVLCAPAWGQIHVGPHNNVGIRIAEDSTTTLHLDNNINSGRLNHTNILSDVAIDSLRNASYSNLDLNTYIYTPNTEVGRRTVYGIENRMQYWALGASQTGYGISNFIRENWGLEDNSADWNTSMYGIRLSHTWNSNAGHYGIFNGNYHGTGVGRRYGIYNFVYTGEIQEDFVNGDQIGIYNELTAIASPEFLTPMALYSVISTPDTFRYAGFFNGNLNVTGKIFHNPSDSTIKKDILPLDVGLQEVLQMNTVKFKYKDNPNFNFPTGTQYGLIAQELEGIVPKLVSNTRFATPDGKDISYDANGEVIETDVPGVSVDYKTVDYVEIIPLLIKAIQEQQATIEAMQAEIDDIQAVLGNLQNSGGK